MHKWHWLKKGATNLQSTRSSSSLDWRLSWILWGIVWSLNHSYYCSDCVNTSFSPDIFWLLQNMMILSIVHILDNLCTTSAFVVTQADFSLLASKILTCIGQCIELQWLYLASQHFPIRLFNMMWEGKDGANPSNIIQNNHGPNSPKHRLWESVQAIFWERESSWK